ncbi:hypothetical protein HU200_006502 [Digitaria exilis]|uniref:Cupin type-1 domain-containing protein n=1 Tax=Digitaria exilis TaxID=1010633 RepID=A0A835FNY1_9POAL|nr:hypothetical protein HU200_006502 [Digitaria exilis]
MPIERVWWEQRLGDGSGKSCMVLVDQGTAGYPCKLQAGVTADDFYYRGLNTTGPTIDPFSIRLSSAFVTRFPGVNGLDISAARVDFAPGGVVPLHSHPG